MMMSKTTENNPITEYLTAIEKLYLTGDAREHSYRGDLQNLLKKIMPNILPTNEPARRDCGAPDYVLTNKNNVPVGYIEAKRLGDDLNHKKHQEQFDRYKSALNNLVFTNYLTFDFYQNGECVHTFEIAKIKNKKIVPVPDNFDKFIVCMVSFFNAGIEPITDSKKLAKMMASKAKLLSEAIEKSLLSDENNSENSSLHAQMQSFKKVLIHDITPKIFADIYAQTIAYGLFAARFHDTTLDTFSRREAADLIPKSNPFLRKLFGFIADYELDSRIAWIIDALAEVFKATNIQDILANFGKSTQTYDPIIHFYENFLAEYDPALRKSRGVWYTPESVVHFIVRSVDEVLKTEFNLPHGLADSSKTMIKIDNTEQEIHKVQILDPATGTGTFLSQIIKHIHADFKNKQGAWNGYVEQHLIPRLNGFEILMASYAIAHLKMDMLLSETGYKTQDNQRFKIYLTNSLEEYHQDTDTLFASWLSAESEQANSIKRDSPVMCIIGNPPYSGESANKGQWIMDLMEDYKKEPNSNDKLKERNPKWINDDYVKFIRYGQHFIEKNNFGVLAYICPHGFLDNPTFRGMRYNLLKTYDTIYTIDLHGNAKKKEVCPDGSKDENVFDIMQGVSINIFIKTGKKPKNALGDVYHYDLYGKRDFKYDFLNHNSLKSIPFVKLPNIAPNYFMVQKNFDAQAEYDKGFGVNALFALNNVGIVTARDNFSIHFESKKVQETITKFLSLNDDQAREHFDLGKDVRDWQVAYARSDILKNAGKITPISYRPFDIRYTYYTGKSKGFHCYPRNEVMQHFIDKENFGLSLCKQFKAGDNFQHIFATKDISESSFVSNKTSEIASSFPLYLYQDNIKNAHDNGDLFGGGNPSLRTSEAKCGNLESNIQDEIATSPSAPRNDDALKRIPNFDPKILERFVTGLSLRFVSDHKQDEFFIGKAEILKNGEAVTSKPANAGCVPPVKTDSSPSFPTECEAQGKGNLMTQKQDSLSAFCESDGNDGGFTKPTINPLDILDYIYAVLHSPKYRETYKEFLKIDFPKIPYPTDKNIFWQLVQYGREIRLYHLMEHDDLNDIGAIASYPMAGDNIITRKIMQKDFIISETDKNTGRLYINDTQYFDNIPVTAWEFYIGGYQPAVKWIKDRVGRVLSFDDIIHYQKIIFALMQTHHIMQKVDEIDFV